MKRTRTHRVTVQRESLLLTLQTCNISYDSSQSTDELKALLSAFLKQNPGRRIYRERKKRSRLNSWPSRVESLKRKRKVTLNKKKKIKQKIRKEVDVKLIDKVRLRNSKSSRKNYWKKFLLDGEEYSVGDTVILRGKKKDNIARIEEIYSDKGNFVKTRLFFRGDEMENMFLDLDENQLVISNSFFSCPIVSISRKCRCIYKDDSESDKVVTEDSSEELIFEIQNKKDSKENGIHSAEENKNSNLETFFYRHFYDVTEKTVHLITSDVMKDLLPQQFIPISEKSRSSDESSEFRFPIEQTSNASVSESESWDLSEDSDFEPRVKNKKRPSNGKQHGSLAKDTSQKTPSWVRGKPRTIDIQHGCLAEEYIVPPCSIFNTTLKYWRIRKKLWKSTGLVDVEGRPINTQNTTFNPIHFRDHKFYDKKSAKEKELNRLITTKEFLDLHYKQPLEQDLKWAAISSFDPVLAEVMCRWYVPPGGRVLDPFAGGATRGIVAATMGLKYTGIELRPEQIENNQKQSKTIPTVKKPNWIIGDSRNILKLVEHSYKADFVFSCPPYFDYEKYSKDERDLSNLKSYQEFLSAYTQIIEDTVSLLRDNRFACFVVSNIRKIKDGVVLPFVSDTISAFTKAGCYLWNDIVLCNAIGTKRFSVRRYFQHSKKVAKVHQNVLIFIKGDPKLTPESIQDKIIHESNKYLEDLLKKMKKHEKQKEKDVLTNGIDKKEEDSDENDEKEEDSDEKKEEDSDENDKKEEDSDSPIQKIPEISDDDDDDIIIDIDDEEESPQNTKEVFPKIDEESSDVIEVVVSSKEECEEFSLEY